jgi:hypothetical protein
MSNKKKMKRTYPIFIRGPCEWRYPDNSVGRGEVKAVLRTETQLVLNVESDEQGAYGLITMERDHIGTFRGMVPDIGNASLSITEGSDNIITMRGLWLEGANSYKWSMDLDVVPNLKDED